MLFAETDGGTVGAIILSLMTALGVLIKTVYDGRNRRKETDAEIKSKEKKAEVEIEDVRSESEIKRDDKRETAVVRKWKELLEGCEARRKADLTVYQTQVQSLSNRLEAVLQNERQCEVKVAELKTQNGYQQQKIDELNREVHHLRVQVEQLREEVHPTTRSGEHPSLTREERRKNDDPSYPGPERRSPPAEDQ